MQLQTPRGVHTEMHEKDGTQATASIPWRCVSQANCANGQSGREEGYFVLNHEQMMHVFPSKYAVSQAVGYIKGKNRDSFGRGVRGEKAQFC